MRLNISLRNTDEVIGIGHGKGEYRNHRKTKNLSIKKKPTKQPDNLITQLTA